MVADGCEKKWFCMLVSFHLQGWLTLTYLNKVLLADWKRVLNTHRKLRTVKKKMYFFSLWICEMGDSIHFPLWLEKTGTWETDMLRRKATVWARWKDPGIKQECYSGILQISLNKNWLANYMLTAGRCLFIYILKTAFAFVDKYHPQDRKLRAQWEVSVLFISSFFHHECF